MHLRLLFALWLVIVGIVSGACVANLTISSPEEAAQIASCTTFTGTISIVPPAPTIVLDGIEELVGNLRVQSNDHLKSLASSTLLSISGSLWFDHANNLTTISFPKLHNIFLLGWQTTPSLKNVGFDTGINVTSMTLHGYFSFEELELNINFAYDIDLDYLGLKRFSLPLVSVGSLRIIQADRRFNLETIEFPRLTWADNIQCIECSNLFMPVLATVNNSFGIWGNGVSKLELPSLNVIGGTLSVMDDPPTGNNFADLSLPALFSLGNLSVRSGNISSLNFSRLNAVNDNIDLSGILGNIFMPNVRAIGGNVSILTTNASLSCNDFDAYKQSGLIKGSYECNGTHTLPSLLPSTSTTLSAPPDKSLSTGTKAGIGAGVPLAIFVILGAIVAMILRSRWQRKRTAIEGPGHMIAESGGKEVPQGEMANGNEAHELQAEHGWSETAGNGIRVVKGTHELAS